MNKNDFMSFFNNYYVLGYIKKYWLYLYNFYNNLKFIVFYMNDNIDFSYLTEEDKYKEYNLLQC